MSEDQASTLETTLAVLVSRVEDLRGDVAAMRTDQATQRSGMVPRTEWEQRNRHVDETFRTTGREIGDLRTELRSRRTPWPAVASVVLAAVALGLTLVQALGR